MEPYPKNDLIDFLSGKIRMIKQIREDCCNEKNCDWFRGCLKGQSRDDECTIGQYLYFLENGGDSEGWSKYYDDLMHPSEEDDGYEEMLIRKELGERY